MQPFPIIYPPPPIFQPKDRIKYIKKGREERIKNKRRKKKKTGGIALLRRNSLLPSRSSASCQYLRESEKEGRGKAGRSKEVSQKEKLRGRVQLRETYIKEENFTIKKIRGKGKENAQHEWLALSNTGCLNTTL